MHRTGIIAHASDKCCPKAEIRELLTAHWREAQDAQDDDGMFVQSEKFVESHGGKLGDISIYGQESNATIHANLHQSRTLATLRDTLLPKLLTGELSVAARESMDPMDTAKKPTQR